MTDNLFINPKDRDKEFPPDSSQGTVANSYMIGGNHYKNKDGGEEHWDRMFRLYGPGYFIGSITKYVERYQKKDGLKDLLKAKHFIEKLIELEELKEQENEDASK